MRRGIKIKININILSLDRLFGPDQVAVKARAIEEAGIDGIVMPDHVVFGSDAAYPFGGWTVDPSETWPEPLTTLAAIAGATRRVDLITNVLIAPLRPAVFLAKQAATLYALSGGRFQLGVGAGWQAQEYEASGLPFAERSDMLFEQLQACLSLWHDRPASHQSRYYTFQNIWCVPGLNGTKASSPLKLWIGVAPTARNARFFAAFNAGWSSIDPNPEAIKRGRDILQAALLKEFGIAREITIRAAPQIMVDGSGNVSIERTIGNLHKSVEAGVSEFDFPMLFCVQTARDFDRIIAQIAAVQRDW